jgi:TonB family protein
MTGVFLSPAAPAKSWDVPFKAGAAISIAFHLTLLVGIPLLLQLFQRMETFERPQTFELISTPPTLAPLTPISHSKPLKKEATRPVPSENPKPKENVDELASLLDEMPAPVHVSTPGIAKYNWYIAQVQEKVERYWNPSSENVNDSVVVSFTIFGDGSISEPVIVASSGKSSLDNLALRAVKLSAPFGKLPPGVIDNKYEPTCVLKPKRK